MYNSYLNRITDFFIGKIIDVKKVYFLLSFFPLMPLFFLLFLSTIILFFKAVRFWILMEKPTIELSFIEICKVSFAGQALSPLPGGKFARGLLLKRENAISMSKSSSIIVTQPLLELIVSAIITLIGGIIIEKFLLPSIALLVILGCIVYLFVSKKAANVLLVKLPRGQFYKTFKKKFLIIRENVVKTVLNKSTHYPNFTFYKCVFIILLANITGGLIFYIIAGVFHLHASYLACIFVYAASIVFQSISILPVGLGVTEGGMAGILAVFEVGFSHAVVLVLLFRVITLLYSIFLGLLVIIIFYSKSLLLNQHGKPIST